MDWGPAQRKGWTWDLMEFLGLPTITLVMRGELLALSPPAAQPLTSSFIPGLKSTTFQSQVRSLCWGLVWPSSAARGLQIAEGNADMRSEIGMKHENGPGLSLTNADA